MTVRTVRTVWLCNCVTEWLCDCEDCGTVGLWGLWWLGGLCDCEDCEDCVTVRTVRTVRTVSLCDWVTVWLWDCEDPLNLFQILLLLFLFKVFRCKYVCVYSCLCVLCVYVSALCVCMTALGMCMTALGVCMWFVLCVYMCVCVSFFSAEDTSHSRELRPSSASGWWQVLIILHIWLLSIKFCCAIVLFSTRCI